MAHFSISADTFREMANHFGTKYAIQKLFCDLDMAGVQTRLFTPDTPMEEIVTSLHALNITQSGVTVRFSHQNALNLPRGFFREVNKCLKFIDQERKNYAIIIQEYTTLRTSFELFTDGNLWYLQVLPGIWEIDSNCPPDILREISGEVVIWHFTQPRRIKVIDNEMQFCTLEHPPLGLSELFRFYTQLRTYRGKLEIIRQLFDPLFCHFYEDDKGKLCFINVRDFGTLPVNEESPQHFYVVKSEADVNG